MMPSRSRNTSSANAYVAAGCLSQPGLKTGYALGADRNQSGHTTFKQKNARTGLLTVRANR